MRGTKWILTLSLGMTATLASAATTTFSSGNEGWGVFFANDGVLGDFIEPTGGNPDAHLRWTMVDTFGCNLHNDSNAAFIGDYSRFSGGARVSIDVRVDDISYFGTQVARNLIVEFVDYNDPGDPYPWTSVWYNLGAISSAQTSQWATLGVAIADPTSQTLPAGWGGYGAEDPVTYEPILPPGRTFANVLANVEEIRFTTFQPGYFYGFTNFQVHFDNPSVNAIPEPATLSALALVAACVARRRG